jgi:hypothetical protein
VAAGEEEVEGARVKGGVELKQLLLVAKALSVRTAKSRSACIRQHTSAYASIPQHTSAYDSMHTSAYVSMLLVADALSVLTAKSRSACKEPRASAAYVSIRQITSAYVRITP